VEQAVTRREIRSAGPYSAVAERRPPPDRVSLELRISGVRNPVFVAGRACQPRSDADL